MFQLVSRSPWDYYFPGRLRTESWILMTFYYDYDYLPKVRVFHTRQKKKLIIIYRGNDGKLKAKMMISGRLRNKTNNNISFSWSRNVNIKLKLAKNPCIVVPYLFSNSTSVALFAVFHSADWRTWVHRRAHKSKSTALQ